MGSKRIQPATDVTLMLTASINPMGLLSSQTMTAESREQDYLRVLRMYLTRFPDLTALVFIENSGWPLDKFHALIEELRPRAEVEFVSLDTNNFPPALGKSYGEFVIMDRGFSASRLIASRPYVVKVTGRIFVDNLIQIVSRLPTRAELAVDLRDHPLYEWLGSGSSGRFCDTRLVLMTPQFWRDHFHGKETLLGEATGGLYIETLFYRVAKAAKADGLPVILRFPVEPVFTGVAGHWHKDYTSPRERTKRAVRGLSRRLVPWLKI